MSNNFFVFDNIVHHFTPQDLKEIDEMSVPTYDQAYGLVKHWKDFYAGNCTSSQSTLLLAKGTAKCVHRCKQFYPELFI